MGIIAGIGSRETPKEILFAMTAIGKWCREHAIWVRSGHAPGADSAFEEGAQEYCIAYLPWQDFGKEFHTAAHYKVPDSWDMLFEHASQFHPAWSKLRDPVRKLMARNSAQVLGLNLDSPVDAVVCWTKDGKDSGGTGQALRIAAANDIPVFNMFSISLSTAARVTDCLCKLSGKLL